MPRIRLDKLVVARNMAIDIEEAKSVIESGLILVDGAVQKSIKSFVDPSSALTFVEEKSKYVSRGGFKLEYALDQFNINVENKSCLDIGSSTGGFSDVLLQRGASRVNCVDVGHGQLDHKIRSDERVNVFEKTNAKNITPEMVGYNDLAVVDVSFTSVIPLIEPISKCLNSIKIVVLIKPQFEVEQKYINSKGIVSSDQARIDCIKNTALKLKPNFAITKLVKSPITGNKGNIEYLCLISSGQTEDESIDLDRIEDLFDKQ
ncbi:MAG: TlyA family RNA methyltransferase [Acidimicrobiia bacterium]